MARTTQTNEDSGDGNNRPQFPLSLFQAEELLAYPLQQALTRQVHIDISRAQIYPKQYCDAPVLWCQVPRAFAETRESLPDFVGEPTVRLARTVRCYELELGQLVGSFEVLHLRSECGRQRGFKLSGGSSLSLDCVRTASAIARCYLLLGSSPAVG